MDVFLRFFSEQKRLFRSIEQGFGPGRAAEEGSVCLEGRDPLSPSPATLRIQKGPPGPAPQLKGK